jgi:hypothetical protein
MKRIILALGSVSGARRTRFKAGKFNRELIGNEDRQGFKNNDKGTLMIHSGIAYEKNKK